MANYEFSPSQSIFKINGNDTRSNHTLMSWVLGVTFASLFVAIVVMLNQGSFYLFLGMLFFNLFLVLIIARLAARGLWARYYVQVTATKIRVWDRKSQQVIFEEKMDVNKLYLANIRQQAGVLSIARTALVYGQVRQEVVEDQLPGSKQILLTLGSRKGVEKVLSRLIQRVKH